MNAASGMRARSLLRRYLWATVALGVFAGAAGGAALGIWGMARRTATVYDRFVAYEDAATLSVFACTDGVTEEEIAASYSELCSDYDYADILAFLGTLPGVEAAGRYTLAISGVAPADRPDQWTRQLVPVAIDPDAVPAFGNPIVVAGSLNDPSVASEVTVNEEAAKRLGVGVGDRLAITPYSLNEFDAAGEGVEPPVGSPTTVTVVGVVRRPGDLVGRLGGTSISEDSSSISAGSAWWEATGGDVARYGTAVAVRTTPGTTDGDILTALRDRWPDRPIGADVGPLIGPEAQRTVVNAIRLQSLGLALVAGLIAIAALVFAGQAVARQVRREWDDAKALDALGMTRGGMVTAAGLRAVALAVVAVGVAAIVAVALSPLGPIGIGRAAEPSPGLSVDGLVLALGLPAVALAVMAFAVAPVATIRRRIGATPVLTRSSRTLAVMPPPGVAGWAMTTSRRAGGFALGSAVVGVALACAAGIAAWSLAASYDDLVASPARFGATWDAQVGNVGSEQQETDTRAALAAIPGIQVAGIKSASGIGSMLEATVVAAEPVNGDIDFASVISGRAPVSDDEVALGRLTLHRFEASVGDTVTLSDPADPSQGFPFEVVGEVVLNDGLSAQPGDGALLTNEAFDQILPENLSQSYAVWIDPDFDRDATLNQLRQAFPTTFIEQRTPRQILNLGLVSGQPVLLAVIVGLLAGAALIHALVMSVRRGRRQIGILKTLGFQRRQVTATVAWHASTIAATALMIGIPLGVVMGRLAWSAIVEGLGIVSSPVVPISALLVMVALVLAVANLAALGPGVAAARTRAATALRTE